mgnify:FL=1
MLFRSKDGRELRQREVIDPNQPESNADIVTKFMANASLAMPLSRAETMRDLILNVEAVKDARELCKALSA